MARTSKKLAFRLNLGRYKKLSSFVEAQAKHETGNFSSEVFKRANNAFGMKNASVRDQLGKEVENDVYRHYKSLTESIKDLALWMDFTNFPDQVDSLETYVDELKKRKYFEDTTSNYLNGMKRFLK